VESEFKFFFRRRHNKEETKMIGYKYEMADLLIDLHERASLNAVITKKRLIRILTDILMFKNGKRFSPKLASLAGDCVKDHEADIENLRFLGTFMLLKKTAPTQI